MLLSPAKMLPPIGQVSPFSGFKSQPSLSHRASSSFPVTASRLPVSFLHGTCLRCPESPAWVSG